MWLFFGMRMGEDVNGKSYYYAIDVTQRNTPKVMWTVGPDQLQGLGQTWSPPTVARVKVGTNGSVNADPQKFVLIFGGGYDMAAEAVNNKTEGVGNRVFMIDASTGALLWSAGPNIAGVTANLKFDKMTNAIPGRVGVFDIDGDAFADRMYAADLGGRLWRFDIYNEKTATNAADPLVTGGVIAQLGYGNVTGATNADNRRFYNAPDVAFIQGRGITPYFNLAIGSGYRGHPLDTTVTDRFFSVRDRQPFARWTQANYNAFTPILDADLTDVTGDPASALVPVSGPGWKFSMTRNAAGEKILAEATTAAGIVLFTSFQPLAAGTGDPCFPANINRAYALTVSGRPALDFNNDGVINNSDVSTNLQQSGIAGEVNIAVVREKVSDDMDNDGIPDSIDTDMDGDGVANNVDSDSNGNGIPDADETGPLYGGSKNVTKCLVGTQILGKCPKADDAVRTFWWHEANQP